LPEEKPSEPDAPNLRSERRSVARTPVPFIFHRPDDAGSRLTQHVAQQDACARNTVTYLEAHRIFVTDLKRHN
jgi:hypothetical protein